MLNLVAADDVVADIVVVVVGVVDDVADDVVADVSEAVEVVVVDVVVDVVCVPQISGGLQEEHTTSRPTSPQEISTKAVKDILLQWAKMATEG